MQADRRRNVVSGFASMNLAVEKKRTEVQRETLSATCLGSSTGVAQVVRCPRPRCRFTRRANREGVSSMSYQMALVVHQLALFTETAVARSSVQPWWVLYSFAHYSYICRFFSPFFFFLRAWLSGQVVIRQPTSARLTVIFSSHFSSLQLRFLQKTALRQNVNSRCRGEYHFRIILAKNPWKIMSRFYAELVRVGR